MLYVSTRNPIDTYTAHRALCEAAAPDGGVYVPFRLPVFTQDERTAFRQQPCCDVIAKVLNLFFGVHITGWAVEREIGKIPFHVEVMQHRFAVGEYWKNLASSYDSMVRCLYGLMTEGPEKLPAGWASVGIKIALLFGLYSAMDESILMGDIAVTAGDYSDVTAIAYAKVMGLPIGITVCTCDGDSPLWDIVNRGEYDTSSEKNSFHPNCIESYLYIMLGANQALQFVAAEQNNRVFLVDEELQGVLRDHMFVAVVSKDRADSVISSMYRTNGYTFDTEAALAYGGLQDYRSSTGSSNVTLTLSKNRPVRIKE